MIQRSSGVEVRAGEKPVSVLLPSALWDDGIIPQEAFGVWGAVIVVKTV